MSAPVRVTDHAVLRYLERVQGFNIEAVREHIADVCKAGAIGASSVKAEGMRFSIASGVVTTVTRDSHHPSKTHQDRLLNGTPPTFVQVGDAFAGALKNIEAKRR